MVLEGLAVTRLAPSRFRSIEVTVLRFSILQVVSGNEVWDFLRVAIAQTMGAAQRAAEAVVDRQPARGSTLQLDEIGMSDPEGTADIDR
jgi:hypothetical protein